MLRPDQRAEDRKSGAVRPELWDKHMQNPCCGQWKCGAALAPRRREGAGVEWVFLLSFSGRKLAFAFAKVFAARLLHLVFNVRGAMVFLA